MLISLFIVFFCRIADFMAMPSLCPEVFYVKMINTPIGGSIHYSYERVFFIRVFLLASPYVIYQFVPFCFRRLYTRMKEIFYPDCRVGLFFFFMMGVLLNYFLIFPLTFRFLATYQVSMEVENTITLSSYMDTLMMMSLMMGIVFEIPVLCWLFAKLGFLTADFMKRYRRHAIVIILIVGAVITPTSDVFTLMMVSVPMYLLYEVSIGL